jgi:7-carboxy-7-deazaguanine synthase
MKYKINEIFVSIQGEGLHTGLLTTFIRFAGCNLRCKWCDTLYSQTSEKGEELTLKEILEVLNKNHTRYVCLTGGEPLVQDKISMLVKELFRSGHEVDIETNGSIPISDAVEGLDEVFISMDVKPPSSDEVNSFDLNNLRALKTTDQLKFIIADRIDLKYTFDFLDRNDVVCNVILTPCYGTDPAFIVEELKKRYLGGVQPKNGDRIRLMLQTHKVIWEADQRGV